MKKKLNPPRTCMGIKVWGARRERHYPIVLAIFSFFLSITSNNNLDISELLFSASISFGSIFTGFVATCLSIMISSNSKIIQRIRESNYDKDLYDYTLSAMLSGFILSCLGILGLLFYKSCSLFIMNCLLSLWIGSLIYCLFSGFRFGRVMFKIFKNY